MGRSCHNGRLSPYVNPTPGTSSLARPVAASRCSLSPSISVFIHVRRYRYVSPVSPCPGLGEMNPPDSLVGTRIDGQVRKRRVACDQCHDAKVKCSKLESPCERCENASLPCHYSFVGRMDKPPGTRNKKTVERRLLAQIRDQHGVRHAEPNSNISHRNHTDTNSIGEHHIPSLSRNDILPQTFTAHLPIYVSGARPSLEQFHI